MKAAHTKSKKMRSQKKYSKLSFRAIFGIALKSAWKWAKENLTSSHSITYIIKETANAICVQARLVNIITDSEKIIDVWVPKSQVSENSVSDWFFGKKKEEIQSIYGRNFTLEF